MAERYSGRPYSFGSAQVENKPPLFAPTFGSPGVGLPFLKRVAVSVLSRSLQIFTK